MQEKKNTYNNDEFFKISKSLPSNTKKQVISGRRTKLFIQSLVDNSPDIIQFVQNKGKKMFQLEFKPETQKLLEQGYYQLSKAKDSDGNRAWINGEGGIIEHAVLKKINPNAIQPYTLALNTITSIVKDAQLDEINRNLELINNKLNTLIRMEQNKIKFKTKVILNFLEDRMEKILVNEDLSIDRKTYIEHVEFFEVNIPVMLKEFKEQLLRIEKFPEEKWWGTKKLVDEFLICDYYIENILIMLKTYVLLLQVYQCFDKSNIIKYNNKFKRAMESINVFNSYRNQLENSAAIKLHFKYHPLIEIEPRKKYREEMLYKLIDSDYRKFLSQEISKLDSVLKKLMDLKPLTLLEESCQKKLEITLKNKNEVEEVFILE